MAKISALCVHETTRRLLEEVASQVGIVVEAKVVPMESALVAVRSAVRQGSSVLIAEDRLWQVLVEPSPLPVVFLGPGAWEVVRALAGAGGDDVAVLHFGPETLGLTSLGSQLGIHIEEVICQRSVDAIREQLRHLKMRSIKWVVGGAAVVKLAEREGFSTQLILPGPESVRHTLLLAIRQGQAQERSENTQRLYCRHAPTLPAGLLLVKDPGNIQAWGGRAVEVADRLRGLIARAPYFTEKLVERASGPGINVEPLGEGLYLVHDIQEYERVLGREVRANALGGDEIGEALVVSVGELDDMIAQIVVEMLKRNGGNRTQVARLLGISRTTLWKRLKELPAKKEASTR